jgi:deoxyribonuclease-4
MPLLGAHMSIAGGYYRAADAAGALGMDTVQIFTKNNNQWRGKPLTDQDVRLFREAISRHNLRIPCAHDSYLINIGSPADELWEKSVDALVVELERADALGLSGVVMHPGSFVTSSEQEGLQRIVHGLDEVGATWDTASSTSHSSLRERRTAAGWASVSTPATSSPRATD